MNFLGGTHNFFLFFFYFFFFGGGIFVQIIGGHGPRAPPPPFLRPCYNVQSLVNKVELIEGELHDFDVVCLTETWLDMRTLNDDLKLNGFRVPYRRDRPGDNQGGICVYVKESIYSQHRPDLEVNDVECLWIEICTKHWKFLLGTFYRSPNSPPGSMLSIETSIGLAFDTTINDVIDVGDFN